MTSSRAVHQKPSLLCFSTSPTQRAPRAVRHGCGVSLQVARQMFDREYVSIFSEEPTPMRADLDALQQERTLSKDSPDQDLRRGSIAENYRRCGKRACLPHEGGTSRSRSSVFADDQCRRAEPARNLRPGPELTKVRAEVSNHLRFHKFFQKLPTRQGICDLRPAGNAEEDSDRVAPKEPCETHPGRGRERGMDRAPRSPPQQG